MNSSVARSEFEWAMGDEKSDDGGAAGGCDSARKVEVANCLAELNLVVDWPRREICHRDGRRCKLSDREVALLACLARKAGTPVSRDEILWEVWRMDPRRTATRTIDMHVSLLRRKLEGEAEGTSVLVTVHRVGYMLNAGA